MPITSKTIDFLSENRLNNSKEWYNAHKKDFDALVKQPLLALSADIGPAMLEIDDQLVIAPAKTVSRVYRDTRFTHDKSLFRDVMWVVFHRGKGMASPTFFFEFSPRCYRYGCGYYQTPPMVKRKAEEMILQGDTLFHAAQRAVKKQPDMPLLGEKYKRTRFPNAPAPLSEWLERKDLGVCHEGKDSAVLFSTDLSGILTRVFQDLAPLYHFMLEAQNRSGYTPRERY